jgi:hypothetical protein
MTKECRKKVNIHRKQLFYEDAHNKKLQLQVQLMVPGCDPLHSGQ